ncbi:hypothetical protein ARMSODRAFT_1084876 [Armillaria solidipes]|uniref:Uncharacterized protein n=1 Tax=Armillaria solidipes TaxID=1076256 RepID=A0A2H3BYB3_9AGAR|nr:hypothetical protein ARMSODRAFT_1084876 [Armillaria solidipes]
MYPQMTSSPTSSDSNLDSTSGLFFEPPFQNAITAGMGWDKNLCGILHLKFPTSHYSAYREIASAYAEILQLFEASNGNPVGFYYRSDLKQILSTAEYFVHYIKWHREEALHVGQLFDNIRCPLPPFSGVPNYTDARRHSKTISPKIETEISLLRQRTGLEQRYKDFDNRRLLEFITRVSMIMTEISIAIFVCMTILVIAFPWHWNFIMSRATVLALTIGAVAYFGFEVSKRIQRVALAVQTLYMHHFLFIWAWNDLKVFLTHVALETDDSAIQKQEDLPNFVSSFQNSFCGKEDELLLLQMRISASPAYSTKEDPKFWWPIGSESSGRRKNA